MDDRARVFLVFHGVIVLLLGLVAGFPYAMAIGGSEGVEYAADEIVGVIPFPPLNTKANYKK